MSEDRTDDAFEGLLRYLKTDRGFDFTGYKRSTLLRRTRKRMDEVGITGFQEFHEYLETHPGEFTELFNTILINVTSFFRDPEAWEALAAELRPRLDAKAENEPVRVWSAGCASGEETYTLLILLAEMLGAERFRERVKIYATDVDQDALARARSGVYRPEDVEAVPPELRDRYFDHDGGRFTVRADLRRFVIFGRHDLVQDAPISHLDLLVCRNALMYFNAEVQGRIVGRFHYALDEGGLLFLGKAEMLRSHGNLFTPVDLKSRLFAKVPRATLSDRLHALRRSDAPPPAARTAQQLRLRDEVLEADPAARMLVSPTGALLFANSAARALFALSPTDLGRPLQDLTISYRPVELRSLIEQAVAQRSPVHVAGVEAPSPAGELRHLDLAVQPAHAGGQLLGVSVTFTDMSAYHRLQAELQEANQELETAFEELQSTNEELETTNEELQSTIEELETTNEELQSTNEELETMNEELQSTNEELETINDELHRRTIEVNHVNAYMTSILASLRVAVAVVDRDSDIRVWNRKAEELWGLRADEVEGHAFQNLDIGLPVERLKGPVRACIDGKSEMEEMVLDAVNRRGRAIRCRVTCAPFLGGDREIHGAVLTMEEWTGAADGAEGSATG
ncbi:MAG TPA: CheR family methyltransferase [Longimicrobiaceae bacterium]|nr:CheR family methyltransferase [Longimicrobiaceae bacterium]